MMLSRNDRGISEKQKINQDVSFLQIDFKYFVKVYGYIGKRAIKSENVPAYNIKALINKWVGVLFL